MWVFHPSPPPASLSFFLQVNDAKARMYWWAFDDNAPARSAQMMIEGRPHHDMFDDEKKVGVVERNTRVCIGVVAFLFAGYTIPAHTIHTHS